MAKASLNNIYDRLNSVSSYHPFTADTFADWSMEAGDIVSISRNGETVTAPISSTTVRWNGSQQVSIESRGEKERESVAKMSAKAFNSGGNGGGGFRSGGRRATQEKDMYTELTQTDEAIRAYAVNRTNGLEAEIKVQAGRIDAVVTENGEIKAGVIVNAINNGTVEIFASKVKIGTSTLDAIMSVSGLGVNIKSSVNISGSNGLAIGAGGFISLGAYSIRLNTLQGMIKSASVSGNVLTLTPFYGSDINFSKATTLSGKWSGGTYTVTAKQNNETVNTNETKIKQYQQLGSVSVIGKYVSQDVYAYATENGGNNAVSTGFHQQVVIDATEVFNNGKAEGAGQYTLFGYFDKYGTVTVEGQTYTAYITQSTSASASHLALYRK